MLVNQIRLLSYGRSQLWGTSKFTPRIKVRLVPLERFQFVPLTNCTLTPIPPWPTQATLVDQTFMWCSNEKFGKCFSVAFFLVGLFARSLRGGTVTRAAKPRREWGEAISSTVLQHDQLTPQQSFNLNGDLFAATVLLPQEQRERTIWIVPLLDFIQNISYKVSESEREKTARALW